MYHQFAIGRKQWVLSDGRRQLLPKTEGDGKMASVFASRDFGFGAGVDALLLEEINVTRRGKKYKSSQAAIEILGSDDKKDLTLEDDPFIKVFGIGSNEDGWWNSFQMCIQLENVIDCLKVMFPDDELWFLFDHSSCHNKTLDDGLSTTKMTLKFGGAQPFLRDTLITEGCLSTHDPKLAIGDTQTLVFGPEEIGPFYLSEKERREKRDDVGTGVFKKRKRKRSELIRLLRAKNIDLPNRKFLMAELCLFAQLHEVETEVEEEVLEKGWVGKQKGLLQILHERGMLDPEKVKADLYRLGGKKDKDGVFIPGSSHKELLASCSDFKNELSLMQHLGISLGVHIASTPKYHAEIAGEGIEYDWALSKNWFKRLPLSERKTRAGFATQVKKALSSEIVTKGRARGSARRARSYILAYIYLDEQQKAGNGVEGDLLLFPDIEGVAKKFSKRSKSHRSAADFDTAFVNRLLLETE